MNRPLATIVIPVYGRTEYIRAAVDSALAQTYPHREIIVVDDGSPHDVRGVLAERLGKVRYLHQKNGGLSAARNLGLREAEGKYVAFLDDDDLLEPAKLEKQIRILEARPEAGLVYSDCYEFGHPGVPKLNPATGRDRPPEEFPEAFFLQPNVRIPTVLLRRDCFRSCGLFDESLPQHEDGDMLLRFALRREAVFSDYPSARVRHHARRMSADRVGMYQAVIRSAEKILSEFPGFREALGSKAHRRLAQLHYHLAQARLAHGSGLKALRSLWESRRLSSEFASARSFASALAAVARGKT